MNLALPQTSLAPGYGFRRARVDELRARASSDPKRLFDFLQIWEPPRRRRSASYILGCDIGDGVGQDRSVCDVLRVPTLEEPAEQVAQYVTDAVSPSQFAYIVSAIGHLYCDADGVEAMAAIETNNHGLSCQDTLQHHLAYRSFYRWEYFDAADPSKRFSTRIGWSTTPQTRPLLIDRFVDGVSTCDPLTAQADLIVNSTVTIDELWSFYTTGQVGDAEAGRGAHDDAIMALAIAYYVSWKASAGEREPLADRRRRKHEAYAARQSAEAGGAAVPVADWRNSAATFDEMNAALEFDGEEDCSAPEFHAE